MKIILSAEKGKTSLSRHREKRNKTYSKTRVRCARYIGHMTGIQSDAKASILSIITWPHRANQGNFQKKMENPFSKDVDFLPVCNRANVSLTWRKEAAQCVFHTIFTHVIFTDRRYACSLLMHSFIISIDILAILEESRFIRMFVF